MQCDILFIVSVLIQVGNTLSGVGERFLAFFEYRNRFKSSLNNIINMLHQENRAKINFHAKQIHPVNIVELENATFAIEDTKPKAGLSLVIKHSKITLIMGANGSGKTSLLRALVGELPLTSGQLRWFCDRDQIVYSSQGAGLFNRTLLENVTYGSKTSNLNDEFIALLPKTLTNRLQEMVGSQSMRLSGGEKQIIANIRAMQTAGETYIFDEPTAHLDIDAQVLFYQALQNNFTGKTVIIVDHNQIAKNYCDEIIDIEYINDNKHFNEAFEPV
jgi:ATP-binding cassette subfamily B protein